MSLKQKFSTKKDVLKQLLSKEKVLVTLANIGFTYLWTDYIDRWGGRRGGGSCGEEWRGEGLFNVRCHDISTIL